MFARTPGFTITAVAVLALGIAANTAVFSIVNTILLKPLPYPDAARVVLFQNTFRQAGRSGSASPTEYNWWRQQTGAFHQVSAYAFGVANLTGDAAPEQIRAIRVSADYLRLCGTPVALGRVFSDQEDLPRTAKTVVLSHAFWQRHFAGDRQVIGRRISLDEEPHEIIGVLGEQNGQVTEQQLGSGDLEFNQPPDVYTPFQIDPASSQHGHFFNVIGRLRPGVSLAAANAQLQAGYAEYAKRWPGDFTSRTEFGALPLQDAIAGGVRQSLLILLGAVTLVLMIACANVANLMLARATGRRREMAIRAAMGAPRGRIVRQLLTESLLLSMAGGIAGLLGGWAGMRAILSSSAGNIPRIGPGGSFVSLDWRVAGFTLALSILTGLLFGLAPSIQLSKTHLSRAMKVQHGSAGSVLAASEMAFAVVLLIGAALLIRTFIAIRQVQPGFDGRHVLTVRVSLTGPRFEKQAEVTRLIQESVRRIRALPGVEAAGTTCCVPLEDRFGLGFQIPDRPEVTGGAGWAPVSAGYFETFRIPAVRGRVFTERDENGPPVVIINQALAKQFWPEGDPLNDRIVMGTRRDATDEPPRRIIGVVGDVRDDALNRAPRPIIYTLAAQIAVGKNGFLRDGPWAWVIRTRMAPMTLSPAIESEMRAASGGLPAAGIRTMDEVMSRSTAAQEFNTLVLTIFGFSALLLAGVGIYGLMGYSVAQRRREIGIRLALGAEPMQIRGMVIQQSLGVALAGVASGLAAAFGLTRLLRSVLFGVEARDPLAFVLVPAIMVAVALIAAWLPAVRASRVDPVVALRYE